MNDRKIIYADDAIDAITNYGKFLWDNFHETCNLAGMIDAIEAVPSVQPERKTGKWINHRNDDGHNIADCNQCENAIQWFDGDEIPRYCCMCGAKMEGEEDE